MRTFRVALSAVLLVVAVACSRSAPAPAESAASSASAPATSSKPLRIAFNTWIGYSSFYIAEEKGMFKKRGVQVETRVIDPLAEKNAALVRGDLDGMGGTIDSAVVSAASGVSGKVVYMFDRSNGTDGIVTTESIKKIEDLKGARVAVEEGFVGHFFLLYALDRARMSPSDVTLIPMSTDAAGAAFVAGKVDVAVTWEPYLSTAKKRRGAHVLISSKELEPILADTLLMSAEVVRTRREDVKALVGALQEANDYWLANPDESNAIVSKRWKMPVDEVKGIMSTDELYTPALQRRMFGDSGTSGELFTYMRKCAELWLKAKVITRPVNVDAIIEPSIVRELFAAGR